MIIQRLKNVSVWKRMSVVIAISVFVLLIIGGTVAVAQEKQVLRVVTPVHTKTGEILEGYAQEFERLYPNVSLELELTSWSQYEMKLISQAAGGMAPDVFEIGSEFVQSFAPIGGILLPLNKYVDEWEEWDEFAEIARKDVEWGGFVYGVGTSMLGRLIVYRKDFFEEAGLDRESPPETWQDISEYAMKLTKRDAQGNITRAGYGGAGSAKYVAALFTMYLHQSGGTLFDTVEWGKETKPVFNSPAGVRALKFMDALYNENKVGLLPGGLPSEAGIDPLIVGKEAMDFLWLPVIANAERYRPEVAEQLGVGPPLKMLPFTEPSGLVFLNKWSISAKTKYPDTAFEVVKFLSSAEKQAEFWAILGKPPTRKDAAKVWLEEKDLRYRKALEWDNLYGRVWPRVPSFSSILYTNIRNALEETLVRGVDPKEALDKGVADVAEVLETLRAKYLE